VETRKKTEIRHDLVLIEMLLT